MCLSCSYKYPKFNSSPLKRYLPNRKVAFQPPFFRGYVKLRGAKFLSSSKSLPKCCWSLDISAVCHALVVVSLFYPPNSRQKHQGKLKSVSASKIAKKKLQKNFRTHWKSHKGQWNLMNLLEPPCQLSYIPKFYS